MLLYGLVILLLIGITPATAIIANDDSFSVDWHSMDLCLHKGDNVLTNDIPDSSPLNAELVSGPSHGSVDLHSDGDVAYCPDFRNPFNGDDTFRYRAYDGVSYSNVATVTIRVLDAPVGSCDSPEFTMVKDTSYDGQISFSSEDSDIFADILTPPAHGSITYFGYAGDIVWFTYVPGTGFVGTDSFEYIVQNRMDGNEICKGTAIIHVVNPPSPVPEFPSPLYATIIIGIFVTVLCIRWVRGY